MCSNCESRAACCVSTNRNGHSFDISSLRAAASTSGTCVLDHDRKTAGGAGSCLAIEQSVTRSFATPSNEVVCDAMKQQSVSSPTDGASARWICRFRHAIAGRDHERQDHEQQLSGSIHAFCKFTIAPGKDRPNNPHTGDSVYRCLYGVASMYWTLDACMQRSLCQGEGVDA